MARRSRGVPQVIAYWWKSPSKARWAASTSSRGGGKLGIPWARLMPSCWLFTRVISRMTDSVNPCTRCEIPIMTAAPSAPGSARRALPASRDGGHDRHGVASLQRGLGALEEADVLLVHVDIDEAAQLAALVEEPLAQSWELALEILDDGGHGVARGPGLRPHP